MALENARLHQREKLSRHATSSTEPANRDLFLEQLANVLGDARLITVGTEQPLTASLTYILLQTTSVLREMQCTYCRLTYGAEWLSLEAMVPSPSVTSQDMRDWMISAFADLSFAVSCVGGALQTYMEANRKVVHVLLKIPYPSCALGPRLRINCSLPVLQMAFTHLAYLAGLTVGSDADDTLPLLTDEIAQAQTSNLVLWITTNSLAAPTGVKAQIDLSIAPMQLREAVEAVTSGESWKIEPATEADCQSLSVREQEIIALLAQGLRDREIASQLYISERTVKFHIKNTVTKLKARTRFQALHQAILNGWISLPQSRV